MENDYTTIVVLVYAMVVLLFNFIFALTLSDHLSSFYPLLIASTVVFHIFSVAINVWDGFGYLFFALLSLGSIFIRGIGWGVWAVERKRDM